MEQLPPRLLLCSDLDRTILPNGPWPESPRARPLLRRLTARPELLLAYVSGRDLGLLEAAVAEYAIPRPDYAIGDVGTTIYRSTADGWQLLPQWQAEIGRDWPGKTSRDLLPLLAGVPGLQLQEEAKQNRYKLSFYTSPDDDGGQAEDDRLGCLGGGDGTVGQAQVVAGEGETGAGREQAAAVVAGDPAAGETVEQEHGPARLLALVRRRLAPAGVRARLVWSIDEEKNCGLLDILPERAGKLAAIRFLIRHLGIDQAATVFAGDSGNDLDALASELNAILVANAPEAVRREAVRRVEQAGRPQTLYCATGNFQGLNGNYSAGVLEGLAHYHPAIRAWL